MRVDVTTVSNVRKSLEVEVPSTDVQTVYGDLLKGYAKRMRVPGFRPGKAPIELVKRQIGDGLQAEVADKLVERFGREAIQREGLKAVQGGVMIRLPEGHDQPVPVVMGEPYKFTLDVDLWPEFEPKEYKGLDIARPKVEVEPEEIEKELNQLRQVLAKQEPVNDRASQSGDHLVAELEAIELGTDFKLPQRRHQFHLGAAGTLPDFNQHLTGRRSGDEVAFEVRYPSEFGNAEIAGKLLTFRGKVLEITTTVLPEMNDETAQQFGVANYAEFREQLTLSLTNRKAREADRVARQRLLDRLLDLNPFDVPEVLIESELRQRLETMGRNLARQGVDPDKLELDWKKLVDDERGNAQKFVREQVLLDAIADREGLTVSATEFDHAIQALAQEAKIAPREARKRLEGNGGAADLSAQLLRSKCLDWLIGQTHIV